MKQLLILGCGYVGKHIAKACIQQNFNVFGTTRNATHTHILQKIGVTPVITQSPLEIDLDILARTTHIIDSIPLTRSNGDTFASQPHWLPKLITQLPNLQWAGYLSTTGVYGNADGAWVDEDYICHPHSPRGIERLKAEQAWLEASPYAEVFRLAGIYGPDRNLIPKLMQGNYKAIKWEPEHFSSRIHVDDIVAALLAAMHAPRQGRIINIADDLPLPHATYVHILAKMIGAPEPMILTPQEGKEQLTPLALSFFSDNKRIRNQLLHDELLPKLNYPSFKDGIHEILTNKEV
jgi:nucleoside-diphosphate-sugar epimerase